MGSSNTMNHNMIGQDNMQDNMMVQEMMDKNMMGRNIMGQNKYSNMMGQEMSSNMMGRHMFSNKMNAYDNGVNRIPLGQRNTMSQSMQIEQIPQTVASRNTFF